jgi:hypothetical protein
MAKELIKRKTPVELKTRLKKKPLSTRIRASSLETLKKMSKNAKTTLSDLTAGIIEDYVEWYETEQKNNRKD